MSEKRNPFKRRDRIDRVDDSEPGERIDFKFGMVERLRRGRRIPSLSRPAVLPSSAEYSTVELAPVDHFYEREIAPFYRGATRQAPWSSRRLR